MVPGDNPRFLGKIEELNADYFVIDLEESVADNNKFIALENLRELEINQNTFVRIPFQEKAYTKEQLNWVISKFGGRIVIPKLKSADDINSILSAYALPSPMQLILLVENPQCFLNLQDIIKDHVKHIKAIGFGSHDFSSAMGLKHNLDYLSFYRNQLILVAKAFGIEYIDGVDMNIRDLSHFEEECMYAFHVGADGKFLIHPGQLESMYEIEYLSEKEIDEMSQVHNKVSSINARDIDGLEFNGKVYEKPHLVRIEKYMKKLAQRNH